MTMLSSIQAIIFGILAITAAALPTIGGNDVNIHERQVIDDTIGVRELLGTTGSQFMLTTCRSTAVRVSSGINPVVTSK